MAFVLEIPSAEDIKKFDLPFWPDLEKPMEERRTWLADRERNVYLTAVGATGNQAFDDNIKQRAGFYLGQTRFNVILEPRTGSSSVHETPYIIHYPALLQILVYISPVRGMIDVLPEVQKTPNEPNSLLKNRSLNEFIALLKEVLIEYKAGEVMNKHIHGATIVSFGF
jgi:hypothetical protein